MTKYAKALTHTPQSEAADPRQVKNSAGGYVFQLDPWQALDRWLILGAEGGTYYANQTKLTLSNAETIRKCLQLDGKKTVKRIEDISVTGRAPKNDPAIFALALAASDSDKVTRSHALEALPRVCRTGTHLFQFAESVNSFRGWGPALRRAVANWYQKRYEDRLIYQLIKYQRREGWSHRDLLRLSHPVPEDAARKAVYRWVTQGAISEETPQSLKAFEELKSANEKQTIQLIEQYGFTHEMIPTEHKNSPAVWESLLQKMPTTALVRNLGKMSAVGLLKPLSAATKQVEEQLTDPAIIQSSKIHPITLLSAFMVYSKGHGMRGSLSWSPLPQISDVLNEAFYLSFGNVVPSGKKTLIALDVSGSMDGGEIAGVPGLTPRMASAAMAMVTMRTEPQYHVLGFTGATIETGVSELYISPHMRLNQVVGKINRLPFGRTDCALPMIYAKKEKLDVEAFQIWTDNETWAGRIHPHQALKSYRDKSQKQATCAVIGCTATDFTIADPSDPGMMDVIGFDTATPNLLASFAKGWV